MPGTSSTATLNYQLTDFAIGHMNDLTAAYAFCERLAPTVHVPGTHGQYKKFDDVNSFKVYNTQRPMGGDPTRVQFAAEDQFFNCKPNALEVTVDEEERRQAGESNPVAQQLLDEGKIKALLNAAALSEAYNRTNYVLGKLAPVAGRGNFSNQNIDPIDQIDEQIDALSLLGGNVSNIHITMDLGAWRTIRSHPLVKRRLTGVQLSEISQSQFREMLIVPVDVMVASISYATNAAGAPSNVGPASATNPTVNTPGAGEFATKLRLLAGNIIIHYQVDNPTVYDPSAFKTFTAGLSSIMSVRSYMAPNGLYGGHFVDWSEDIEQTSALSARRLALS